MKKLIILLSILTLNSTNEKIYCDIKGNIKKPGVYEIKDNYTIQDIINEAGGLKKNAYTNNINLSKKVTDEMVIYIFSKNEIDKVKKQKECVCETIYKYIECEEEIIINKVESNNNMKTETTTITSIPLETTTKKTTPTTQITITNKTDTVATTTKKIEKPTTTKIEIPTTTITTTQIEDSIININSATLEELMTLNGLGEKKAKAIIEYRNINGLFTDIEDIMNVSGIGKTTFEKIKEYIKV